MGVADIPLLGQIKGRLGWLDERQRVIAENVANADTPGFVGRDLKQPTDFAAALRRGGGLQMVRTNVAHIAPAGQPAAVRCVQVARFRDHARRQLGGGRGADAEDGREPHGL
jgi:flagellar basal body rod protein FlgB